MPDPAIRYLSLANHVRQFGEIRNQDQVPGGPDPDLLAARYSLTGWDPESQHITGINTARDVIGDVDDSDLPYIRRDYDSVMGFTRHCAVSSEISYYPNPPMGRTLSKAIHITFKNPTAAGVS
jgi:hypothetical protein